jgi:hypothetical protein
MAAIVAALLLRASPAVAISFAAYRFTEFANTDTGVFLFGTPAINDKGTVAVVARLDAGGQVVLAHQALIANTTDSSLDIISVDPNSVSINNNNTVAFSGRTSNNRVIFASSGGLISTVIDDSGSFSADGSPIKSVLSWDMADSADIFVFHAHLDSGRDGIFQRNLGNPEIFTRIRTDDRDFEFDDAAVNAQSNLALRMDFEDCPSGTFCLTTREQIFNGPTVIMDTNDEFDVEIGASAIFDHIDMNDAGTIAFRQKLDNGFEGIFTHSPTTGQVTRFADTSGPFQELDNPSISRTGGVAFFARMDAGGGAGIFRGPNPVADKIIGIGDVIGTRNGTVRTVAGVTGFGNDGFSGLGRVAFTVIDQLGTQFLITGGLGVVLDIDLNNVAQLSTVTDNKRDITQEFTFPSFSDTQLMFDYRNLTPGATLIVSINGIEVGNVVPRGTMSDFLSASFPIDPIFLSGDNDIPEILKFELIGGSGMTFQLDNIRFSNLNLVNGDFSTGDLSGWQFGDGDGVVMVTNGLDLIFVPEPATSALALPNLSALVLAFSRRPNRSVRFHRRAGTEC